VNGFFGMDIVMEMTLQGCVLFQEHGVESGGGSRSGCVRVASAGAGAASGGRGGRGDAAPCPCPRSSSGPRSGRSAPPAPRRQRGCRPVPVIAAATLEAYTQAAVIFSMGVAIIVSNVLIIATFLNARGKKTTSLDVSRTYQLRFISCILIWFKVILRWFLCPGPRIHSKSMHGFPKNKGYQHGYP